MKLNFCKFAQFLIKENIYQNTYSQPVVELKCLQISSGDLYKKLYSIQIIKITL